MTQTTVSKHWRNIIAQMLSIGGEGVGADRQITRNSLGDEIANVNFRYDDIVHALQNTIDSCMNSATDWLGYVLEHSFTKFSEITQCNGHYAVQSHSRSPILVPLSLGWSPANIAINDISPKTRIFGLHFRCRKYWCIFNHFYVIRPKSYRIRWN